MKRTLWAVLIAVLFAVSVLTVAYGLTAFNEVVK